MAAASREIEMSKEAVEDQTDSKEEVAVEARDLAAEQEEDQKVIKVELLVMLQEEVALDAVAEAEVALEEAEKEAVEEFVSLVKRKKTNSIKR